MRMKRYETYKDSGVEWLGEVPGHWDCLKLKRLCDITDGTHYSPSTKSEGMPYITVSNVHDDFIDVENANKISQEDYDTLVRQGCQPQPGDVLLAKDGTVGRTAIVTDNQYVVLSSLGILHPKAIDSKYLKYSLDSHCLQEQMSAAMAGSALRRITISKINDFVSAVPPIAEQQSIAAYLDFKTQQLDAIISENEAQVEDLQKYRQSIISKAVTRGLNPDVEMKEGGVEWIGKVPGHWEINKLKYFSTVQTGSTPSTSNQEYWDNPTENWFTPSDFNEGLTILKDSSRKISLAAMQDNACRVFKAGTVLIVGIGGTLGKVGLATTTCSANQQLNAVEFNEQVIPAFGAYYLTSIKDFMRSLANAATLPILNQSATKDIPFLCPPKAEQQAIADYLDTKTSQIDNLVNEIQAQLADLRSYKSSLITEAVTGKVDVRDWAAAN